MDPSREDFHYVLQHPELAKKTSEPRHFRTRDFPTQPTPGDQTWLLHWTLDDGTTLYLEMGKEGHAQFRAWMLREELDDAADEAMKHLAD